jgi:hypothetical protein
MFTVSYTKPLIQKYHFLVFGGPNPLFLNLCIDSLLVHVHGFTVTTLHTSLFRGLGGQDRGQGAN